MFIATDKSNNLVVSGQSKGQVHRFLVQMGLNPDNYKIKEFDDTDVL